MQKSIRQSIAWLHSWTGLLFGWLLFAIFLMGALSYYRHEISLWMQPPLAQIQVNQDTAYIRRTNIYNKMRQMLKHG